MENPASRRSSFGTYRPPTSALTFGFRRPVPRTTRPRPAKNVFSEGTASTKCPSAITIPPKSTDRRAPRKLSARKPPGMERRYTAIV
jgi:hypothetical protein